MPDKQSQWDHEDDRLFRERLRKLRVILASAEEQRARSRQQYSLDCTRAREARQKLDAFLEEDTTSLPLFDHARDREEIEPERVPLGEEEVPLNGPPDLLDLTPQRTREQMIDDTLCLALHSSGSSESHWSILRAAGATDADLKVSIAVEFASAGDYAFNGPGTPWACRGGKDPAFWYDSKTPTGKPTLRGKVLIARVRELLKIPEPAKT